jgi:hypothetical protein
MDLLNDIMVSRDCAMFARIELLESGNATLRVEHKELFSVLKLNGMSSSHKSPTMDKLSNESILPNNARIQCIISTSLKQSVNVFQSTDGFLGKKASFFRHALFLFNSFIISLFFSLISRSYMYA